MNDIDPTSCFDHSDSKTIRVTEECACGHTLSTELDIMQTDTIFHCAQCNQVYLGVISQIPGDEREMLLASYDATLHKITEETADSMYQSGIAIYGGKPL